MLWTAALLGLILWGIGWQSGFLGWLVHVFPLLSLLAVLGALVPRADEDAGVSPRAPAGRDRDDRAA